jgi:heme oxygenase
MSLKELTKENHTAAEKTKFMKAVFKKRLPMHLWADFTYQKSNFYASIETVARDAGLTLDCLEVERALRLYQDAKEMSKGNFPKLRPITIEYSRYILDLAGDPDKIMAHFYTWHMGDLHGGQMIKKMVDAPHRNLEFDNIDELKTKIRAKIRDDMAPEANEAFRWAIRIMESYNDEFDLVDPD